MSKDSLYTQSVLLENVLAWLNVDLVQCDLKSGAHGRLKLDEKGVSDMQQHFWAYNSWNLPDRVAKGWSQWIHETLNNHSEDPRSGQPEMSLSVEVVLGWSKFRISLVVLLPVYLSLAIGLWLNSRDWSNLATIQTAWGIASYIATAGARKYYVVYLGSIILSECSGGGAFSPH